MNLFHKWALAGAGAGITIGLFDAGALVFAAREMFFSLDELFRTAAATIGLVAGAGLLAALFFAPLHWIWRRWINDHPLFQKTKTSWALLTVPAGAVLYPALWQLTSGPQASQIPGRPLWVLGASTVFALAVAGAVVGVPRFAARSTQHSLAILGVALPGAFLLQLADLKVLVRLYPVFHSGLSLVSFAILAGAAFLLIRAPRRTLLRKIPPLALALVALWGLGGGVFFATRHNPRFVATERTATATEILSAAGHLRGVFPSRSRRAAVDVAPTATVASQAPPVGPAFTRPGANVVLLSIDAMRFDRLALGGATRQIAPNLDALAKRSVFFTRAYTPAPHTSYAISSLMTGKFTRPLFQVPGAPAAHETWPEILHRFRYDTAAFFTRAIFFIDKPKFKHYWDTSYGFSYRKVGYEITAAQRVNQVIEYLNQRPDDPRPYFAWAHFFEPHEPYDSGCLEFGASPEDRYDCEIANVDRELKKLLDHLEAHSPNTVVIVLADHGEEFGEHGGKYHGTTLYDEQVRVPLFFVIPDIEPRTVDAPVSLVDVLGTVLGILDVPVPARVRSRDLTQLMLGAPQSTATHAEADEDSMALTEDHKLICSGAMESCRLYDLISDPRELKNIAGRKPAVEKQLRASLSHWKASHAEYELRPVTTEAGPSAWPKAIRSALAGDVEHAEELVALLESHASVEVRHKAAALLYERSLPADLSSRAREAAVGDPIAEAWIVSATVRQNRSKSDVDRLTILQTELPRKSAIWRRGALTRLDNGDLSAIDLVADVVVSSGTPLDERLEGIGLLEQYGNNKSAARLLELMNDYQVTLATARVFAALRYKPAIDPMLARLARERFPDRRAAFVDALSGFDTPEVHKGVAAELAREELPPGILNSLHELRLIDARRPTRNFVIDDGRQVFLSNEETILVPGSPQRVAAYRSASTGEETLEVLCDDRSVGQLHFPAGVAEAFTGLAGCPEVASGPSKVALVSTAGTKAPNIQLFAVVSQIPAS